VLFGNILKAEHCNESHGLKGGLIAVDRNQPSQVQVSQAPSAFLDVDLLPPHPLHAVSSPRYRNIQRCLL
jgi:hypothetical protein